MIDVPIIDALKSILLNMDHRPFPMIIIFNVLAFFFNVNIAKTLRVYNTVLCIMILTLQNIHEYSKHCVCVLMFSSYQRLIYWQENKVGDGQGKKRQPATVHVSLSCCIVFGTQHLNLLRYMYSKTYLIINRNMLLTCHVMIYYIFVKLLFLKP